LVDLLYCEILKLKRSEMFWISVLGAVPSPFMCFVEYLRIKAQYPERTIWFRDVFSANNLYVLLLISVVLYGVIAAYLFSREYTENTLKNVLTIPVSKTKFMLVKYLMLFLWIMVLTLIAWGLLLVFGQIAQLAGFSWGLAIEQLGRYLVGGCLAFLLTSPAVFLALRFKNLVPPIIFSTAITLVNVLMANVEERVLFPWSAIYVISSGKLVWQYPLICPYIAVFGMALVGLTASVLYFKSIDIL